MARSEARLSVEIWNDPDFLALSADAQRMYMFLISQSDLAHDGVLALRERRWPAPLEIYPHQRPDVCRSFAGP